MIRRGGLERAKVGVAGIVTRPAGEGEGVEKCHFGGWGGGERVLRRDWGFRGDVCQRLGDGFESGFVVVWELEDEKEEEEVVVVSGVGLPVGRKAARGLSMLMKTSLVRSMAELLWLLLCEVLVEVREEKKCTGVNKGLAGLSGLPFCRFLRRLV